MRKILITLVFSSLVLFSCTKTEDFEEPIVQDLGFNFENTNGTLSFPTVEDYESAITYINSDPSHIDIFNENNGFVSLYSISEEDFLDEKCAEIISTLLNSSNEIIIQDVQFILDFNSQTLIAIHLDSEEYVKSVSNYKFSFDDYVLYEVFDQKSIKKEVQLDPCPYKNQEAYVAVLTYHDVEMRQQYLKLGIYYSLTAKITKEFPEDYDMTVETKKETCVWRQKNNDTGSKGTID